MLETNTPENPEGPYVQILQATQLKVVQLHIAPVV